MAMPFLNHTENPLNLPKLKKNPKKSNLNSFWAFILSTFIYISVFYVFNLSPSSLLYTTKFWFIISNTLILILAADFGASKDRDIFDEDYEKNNVRTKIITTPSYEMVPYVRNHEKMTPTYRVEEVDEEPQEKIINMVAAEVDQEIVENKHDEIFPTHEKFENKRARTLSAVGLEKATEKMTLQDKHEEIFPITHEKLNEKLEKKKLEVFKKRRARTLSAVGVAAGEMVVLQRTLSERHEEPPRLEENEFSRMSDEELNRRVEEFIRRCNMQIRAVN